MNISGLEQRQNRAKPRVKELMRVSTDLASDQKHALIPSQLRVIVQRRLTPNFSKMTMTLEVGLAVDLMMDTMVEKAELRPL